MLKIKIIASVLLSSIVTTTMRAPQTPTKSSINSALFFFFGLNVDTQVYTEWITELAQKRTAKN